MNDVLNTTIADDHVEYLNYPYNSSVGMTIQVNITSGKAKIYISTDDTISNPSEAFYNAVIETDGYADEYVSCNTSSDKVYMTIVSMTNDSYVSLSIDVSTGKPILL